MKLGAILTVISFIYLLSGCQSVAPQTETTASAKSVKYSRQTSLLTTTEQPVITTVAPPAIDLWDYIRRDLSWHTIHNAQIGKARDHYLRQRRYLPVVAERASLYLYYIVEEVQKRGMPMEIALLPLVESTLNPFASSSSHAAGLWQIMPATGRHLGLENDWWYDGRRDLRDSTRAALDYLEALHAEFDEDWLLALAAYNSGQGRVARARKSNRKKGLKTDYWSLKLPRETRNYIPKLIALTQIVAYPEAFSVEIPGVANAPAFEIADTGGQLEMTRAADLAGIDLDTLRALNPGQLRWATSPDMPPQLLLPVGTGIHFAAGLAALTPDDRVQWQYYRIERGDNLLGIARKFDTQVALLREVNGIRGSMIRAGNTLMIPQGSAWASSLAMASTNKTPTARGYQVRQGDSLHRIAGKFNVSISDIITWNALQPNKYLQPGQKLTLYVRGS
ncbi:MAG: lytic transglycosylase [Gammaproteobacteria bacterium]|nr:MAG: lytic transglycosylase [Gammaproteobacteria bacterium]